eukprot:14793938-Alexandrium_andersonii.AAC.1
MQQRGGRRWGMLLLVESGRSFRTRGDWDAGCLRELRRFVAVCLRRCGESGLAEARLGLGSRVIRRAMALELPHVCLMTGAGCRG